MKYRTLPGTQLSVSQVGLGTMTWGEQNTEGEAHAQLDYAVAQGVNFIDTAEMYPIPPAAATQGRSEAMLGRWLARQPRERLVIASKVAGPGRRDWIRGGRTDLTAANIAEACELSLARLATDYLDLFQIHWPQRSVPMFGALEFVPGDEAPGPSIRAQVEGMAALIAAGKIRHYGLSNETTWGVCAFREAARAAGVPGPVTVQKITDYRLHLAQRRDAPPVTGLADLKGRAIVGYIPDMIFDRELDYLGRIGAERVALASNSVSVQLMMLRQAGVGIVHDFALPFAPELERVLTDEISLTRAFWLIRHADDGRVARLNRFADQLVRRARAEMARLEAGPV